MTETLSFNAQMSISFIVSCQKVGMNDRMQINHALSVVDNRLAGRFYI